MLKFWTILAFLFLSTHTFAQNFVLSNKYKQLISPSFIKDTKYSKVLLLNSLQPITINENIISNRLNMQMKLSQNSILTFDLLHKQTPRKVFNTQKFGVSYTYKIKLSHFNYNLYSITLGINRQKYNNLGLSYPSMLNLWNNPIIVEPILSKDNTYFYTNFGTNFCFNNNSISFAFNNISIPLQNQLYEIIANLSIQFYSSRYIAYYADFRVKYANYLYLLVNNSFRYNNFDLEIGILMMPNRFFNIGNNFIIGYHSDKFAVDIAYSWDYKTGTYGTIEISFDFNLKKILGK